MSGGDSPQRPRRRPPPPPPRNTWTPKTTTNPMSRIGTHPGDVGRQRRLVF